MSRSELGALRQVQKCEDFLRRNGIENLNAGIILEAGLVSTSFRVSENIPLYLQCRGGRLVVIEGFGWTVLSVFQESWVVLPQWDSETPLPTHCGGLSHLLVTATMSPAGLHVLLHSEIFRNLSKMLCQHLLEIRDAESTLGRRGFLWQQPWFLYQSVESHN